jgi:hypothetical protein
MEQIEVGNSEIDILAVRLNPPKTGIEKKVHVEITVSGRPGGPPDPSGLKGYINKKFNAKVNKRAEELLGPGYEKWVVIGKIAGGREPTWVKGGPACGVEVFSFADIVSEYTKGLTKACTPKDDIGKLLDTLRSLSLLN